jgi:hypothetical protein
MSGIEDKVKKLDQSDKDKEKSMKKIKSEHARALRFMPMNLGH